MNQSDKHIAVVIPVFNAQRWVEELVNRTIEALKQIDEKSFSLVLVDDGSTDSTWTELVRLKELKSEITIVKLSSNYGQHAATLCGLKYAQASWVVTLDDDLEYKPEDISTLLNEIKATGVDLVYGISSRRKNSIPRKLYSKTYRGLSRIINNGGRGSSFRCMKGALAENIAKHSAPFVFIDELCLWNTRSLGFVFIETTQSKRITSGYQFNKLWQMTIGLLMISSDAPLRLVRKFGFVLMAINTVVGGWFLVKKLFLSQPVEGYTSLIVSVLFLTGAILFGMAVLAEYMSKLLLAAYRKPPYQESEVK
jgi:polyisoprenyl-phosphate glycosyltransferase